jgi:hypothetical protein
MTKHPNTQGTPNSEKRIPSEQGVPVRFLHLGFRSSDFPWVFGYFVIRHFSKPLKLMSDVPSASTVADAADFPSYIQPWDKFHG